MTIRLLHFVGGVFLLVLPSFLFISCEQKNELPDLTEFTRSDREQLGEFIQWELDQDGIYNIISNAFPYDSLYWYIQTLYDQSTTIIRRDLQSPANNRWDQQRSWKVSIIDDDTEQIAFVLPGGDLFLSSGLLKSLERTYELYYFLAFEANLMQEGYLLEQLVREYNAITLRNLISGTAPANSTTLDIITEDFPTLVFEPETVELIDRDAIKTICETSIYSRMGIAPFLLNNQNESAAWLASRKTYGGRPQNIEGLELEGSADCGDLTGNGAYAYYVLSVLD